MSLCPTTAVNLNKTYYTADGLSGGRFNPLQGYTWEIIVHQSLPGPCPQRQGGSCTMVFRPHISVYRDVLTGREFSRTYYGAELDLLQEGPGDYCIYCGTFNGPNGEYRMGWDCFQCGGN